MSWFDKVLWQVPYCPDFDNPVCHQFISFTNQDLTIVLIIAIIGGVIYVWQKW